MVIKIYLIFVPFETSQKKTRISWLLGTSVDFFHYPVVTLLRRFLSYIINDLERLPPLQNYFLPQSSRSRVINEFF